MSEPILSTKLYIPPVRPKLISRPRLTHRLNEGLQAGSKLILISAPPGFGKTTLLSEWIHAPQDEGEMTPGSAHSATVKDERVAQIHPSAFRLPPFTMAWISLDEQDNDPVRFWSYVITAVDEVHPGLGGDAMSMLHSPQAPPIETTLTHLVNAITTVSDRIVLILDDYHVIRVEAVHQALTFLVDHLPPKMHVILTSRVDPPLPLTRLRVRGQLTELRASDLRFTLTEAVAFFNQVMGLNLSPEDVIALENRTEGWVAGLQLAALSMQGVGDTSNFVRAFTGSHHYIIDYLAEEVLSRQPAPIQTFLLQTSILDRLHGALCDAVLGVEAGSSSIKEKSFVPTVQPPGPAASGQEILEYLEQANLFLISLDGERRWYRYHHLFADFLKANLQQRTQPEELATLHRRASRWYANNGAIGEGVRHALTAGDHEQAAQLIEQIIITLLTSGEVITVTDWLNVLPEALVYARPRLSVGKAWALIIINRFAEVEDYLQAAEEVLSATQATRYDGDDPVAQGIWGEIAAIRAMMMFGEGQAQQAIELCQQALARLPTDNLLVRSIITMNLGMGYERVNQLNLARQTLTEAIAIARAADNFIIVLTASSNLAGVYQELGLLHQTVDLYQQTLDLVAEKTRAQGRPAPVAKSAYIGLAEVLREQNKLETAKSYLTIGLDLASHADMLGPGTVIGYLILARILQAQGDETGAAEAIQQAVQMVEPSAEIYLWVTAIQARLWLAQGNLAEAAKWAQNCNLPLEDDSSFVRYPGEYTTLARILIAQSRFEAALDLLHRLQAAAESTGRQGWLLEILLLQALTLHRQGKSEQAISPLVRALTLAEPEGYVRMFVDEGLPLAQLLHIVKTRRAGPIELFVDNLLNVFPTEIKTTLLTKVPAQPSIFNLQPLPEPLSERELEVLSLVAAGLSNQDIAEKLVIAEGTVKKHLHNIFGKLDVRSRTQAVMRATELQLL